MIVTTIRVSYTNGMAKNETFQLDTSAANTILTDMAAGLVKQSGDAIAARATSMAGSTSTDPPQIEVFTSIGTLTRGKRAIATVKVTAQNAHQLYIGRQALTKAKDAGRV